MTEMIIKIVESVGHPVDGVEDSHLVTTTFTAGIQQEAFVVYHVASVTSPFPFHTLSDIHYLLQPKTK